MPVDWGLSFVAALHKKGRVDDCSNYRPISLICTVHKVYTSLILARILRSGAEARLTQSQFGFRKHRGTNDAIFAARRHLELAWAHRIGGLAMLALDWRQAFDSINTECLLVALHRFGLPDKVVEVIRGLYANRRFQVKNGNSFSQERQQRSGISQGCPLSPFLFVMMMTVLLEDAVLALDVDDKDAVRKGQLA